MKAGRLMPNSSSYCSCLISIGVLYRDGEVHGFVQPSLVKGTSNDLLSLVVVDLFIE